MYAFYDVTYNQDMDIGLLQQPFSEEYKLGLKFMHRTLKKMVETYQLLSQCTQSF